MSLMLTFHSVLLLKIIRNLAYLIFIVVLFVPEKDVTFFFTAISRVLKFLKVKFALERYLVINKSQFFCSNSSQLWTERCCRLKGSKYFRRGYKILSFCCFLSRISGWDDIVKTMSSAAFLLKRPLREAQWAPCAKGPHGRKSFSKVFPPVCRN